MRLLCLWSIKVKHLLALLQDKRLVSQPSPLGAGVEDSPVSIPQRPPVARLRRSSQVSLAERAHAVVRDALCLLGVGDQRLEARLQVAEVACDLDVVLLRPRRNEQVVVVLDVLQLVCDNDRSTRLAVFKRRRVRPS